MSSLSIWHWIVVIAVVLLLFGRGKISDLMGDVAQGIKSFKKGMQDDDKAPEKPAEPGRPSITMRRRRRRRRGRMSAARRSDQASRTGVGLKTPIEKRRDQPQILLDGLGRGRLARAEEFMFDIGWSELVVIAVVALIAIGPKELPGVLRMVGQWMGKARKMAGEFQGQFQEAMREAEMADIKKSFDEVKDIATGFAAGNLMTSLQKDVGDALQIGDIDKPADESRRCASGVRDRASPSRRRRRQRLSPETFVEAEAHTAASEPLAITREVQAAAQDVAPRPPDILKDAKAS